MFTKMIRIAVVLGGVSLAAATVPSPAQAIMRQQQQQWSNVLDESAGLSRKGIDAPLPPAVRRAIAYRPSQGGR